MKWKNTRKTLERIPEDKWQWKPHDKSGSVGWLAGHIATMPGMGGDDHQDRKFLITRQLDGPNMQMPKIENKQQLLAEFDKNVAETRGGAGRGERSGDHEGMVTAGGRQACV